MSFPPFLLFDDDIDCDRDKKTARGVIKLLDLVVESCGYRIIIIYLLDLNIYNVM